MNLAITELSDGVVNAYIIALAVSGVLMLLVAAIGFGSTGGARVLSALFGLGFLGYAIYLEFFFEGGVISVFYYAFVAPFLVIITVIRNRKSKVQPAPAPPAA